MFVRVQTGNYVQISQIKTWKEKRQQKLIGKMFGFCTALPKVTLFEEGELSEPEEVFMDSSSADMDFPLNLCHNGNTAESTTALYKEYNLQEKQRINSLRQHLGFLLQIFLIVCPSLHFWTWIIALFFLVGSDGSAGLIANANFRVQWKGEGSVERWRGSSAFTFLLAPVPLCRPAAGWIRVLDPVGADFHMLLPPKSFFRQTVTREPTN